MAAERPGVQAAAMDQFNAYFQTADLNKDGRISGQEAVAFFQGSNLSKEVLAQIWTHSDKNNAGFLGRLEFYNMLRLATVAQTGRELTREIVKAALEGPAAARIPPPRINLSAISTPANPMFTPRPPVNNMMVSSAQMAPMSTTQVQGLVTHTSSNQVLPNMATSNHPFPPSVNQFVRPPVQPTSASSMFSGQFLSQGISGGSMGNLGGTTQISRDVPSLSQNNYAQPFSGLASLAIQSPQSMPLQTTSVLPKSLDTTLALSKPADKDIKASVVSGNGFGGDAFSVSQPKQDVSSFTFPSNTVTSTSATSPVVSGSVPVQIGQPQSFSSLMTGSNPLQQTQPLMQNFGSTPRTAVPVSSVTAVVTSSSDLSQTQTPWPKMTNSNLQKYMKVFVEVDKDRDGKITGEEARNLFLSWRLPREVLKQVWDLSDQDGDSMLSLREFCIALYLMERYREGRSLPALLPNSLKYDDALLQSTSQAPVAYGNISWQPNHGFSQQVMPVRHSMTLATASESQQKVQMSSQIDVQMMQQVQQKSVIPVVEKQIVNHLDSEQKNALNLKLQEASEIEKEIMDSKEKLEFYRSKMQDLVLYKSRCENVLNEITEKASADKQEVESLAKKYEEKYKQVGDLVSKLTIEEATYRDIQGRKAELHSAIVKMEQGGSADGLLQVRADRIQSDLEELAKGFSDRCKRHGLHVKPTSLIEIPFGWQAGIPNGAADWDEDWDKFEDDGFTLVKDLTVDGQNIVQHPRSGSSFVSSEKTSKNDLSVEDSLDFDKVEKYSDMVNGKTESQPVYSSENSSMRSPSVSPRGRSIQESPTRDLHSSIFQTQHDPLHTFDDHSDHDAAESTISGDKFVDESWGATFDTNDDVDSIWGFNTFSKESGGETNKQYSFDSEDFGLDPIRTHSPGASSVYGKERTSFFDNSVPATPSFSSDPSPRYNDGLDRSFDSFSRFDSFNTQNQGNLARFDSMRSTSDFDSSGFFSQAPNLARFDSIRSTSDPDHGRAFSSFDDSDPFGTGPFRSSESHSSNREIDNWSAFH